MRRIRPSRSRRLSGSSRPRKSPRDWSDSRRLRVVRRAGQGDQARLLEFLIAARREGKQVVGYGAPGKGNTLLNYCGIRTDFLDYTVDRNTYKQGKFLPGTHIPILAPEKIRETRPDYVLILPWNLKDEIMGPALVYPRLGRAFRGSHSRSSGPSVVGIAT